jgi:hypothetical protein
MKNCQQCGITQAQAKEAGKAINESPIHTESNPQHLCSDCMKVIYPGFATDDVLKVMYPEKPVEVEAHKRKAPRRATPAPTPKKTTKKKSSTSGKG